MPYLNNIPQPSDQIASSQPEILGNFEYIQTTMQVDHAWDGSGIPASIDGTHQKISMPNQAVDITSLGATGCALIQYAIGGNLFTWNGVKNPISGISAEQTLAMTTSNQNVLTLPANSIGIVIFVPSAGGGIQYFPFFSSSGQLYLPTNPISPGPNVVFTSVTSSLTLQARLSNLSTPQNYIVKHIYWPI